MMGDNEQNATNPADDQGTTKAESSEQSAVREGQVVTGAAAPADDDIIIK